MRTDLDYQAKPGHLNDNYDTFQFANVNAIPLLGAKFSVRVLHHSLTVVVVVVVVVISP